VSLTSTHLAIDDGTARVKLTCVGAASCTGKLTLTIKSKRTKRHERRRAEKFTTETIAKGTFSIPNGVTTTRLTLNAAGKALLSGHHGRLGATLSILKSSPVPSQTHAVTVHLIRQKTRGDTLGG